MLEWVVSNNLAHFIPIRRDSTCTVKRDVGIEFQSRRGRGSMDARALSRLTLETASCATRRQ